MSDKLDAMLKGKFDGAKTLTAAVQEDMAAKTFALATITESVAARAALGFDDVEIMPPVPVDLRRTNAVKESGAALVKAGFELEWKRRQPRPDEPERWSLVVSWRAKP
jgi:hypothetical protein